MNPLTIDKLSYVFVNSLTEVISKMAGVSIDVLSSEADSKFDNITGVMSLSGKNHGILFISAGEDTLRTICSYMTGIDKKELNKGDVEDTLCELVNMTAGNAKLRTNNTDHTYTLSPPLIINGENMSINTKKRINVISRVLGNGEISVKLKVIFYT